MGSEATAKRFTDQPQPAPASGPAVEPPLFAPLRDLDRRGKLLIAALVLLANIPLIHYFFRHVLTAMPVAASVPFLDDFNRQDLGPNYWTTGGDWRIEDGELHQPGVKNNPLWLQAALPDDVAVDFDVRGTQEADLKFELFGDGLNHASGYVFIFGGWNNQVTTIARLNEHGVAFDPRGIGIQGPINQPEQSAVAGRSLDELQQKGFDAESAWRIQRTDLRVQPGVRYHMHVERRGGELKWFINNQLVLQVNDRYPLKGKGHDRFGPSGWESDAWFDNLSIQPLR